MDQTGNEAVVDPTFRLAAYLFVISGGITFWIVVGWAASKLIARFLS